jgi:signal transduction histidine kinase
MSHADAMYKVLVVAGAAIYCCIMLAWRRPGPDGPWSGISRERLRQAGLVLALFVLACSAVLLAAGSIAWPATLIVPAVLVLIACAPPQAVRLMPLALIGVGALGVVLTLLARAGMNAYGGGWREAGWSASQMQSWSLAVLLVSLAFIAAGLWLMWRAGTRSTAAAPPRQPRWGLLLLPLAVVALGLLIGRQTGHSGVTAAVVLAGVALIIALLLPAVSADLTAVAVLALGLFSLLDVVTPPRVPAGAFAVSPGGVPQAIASGPADLPLVGLAAVQCAAILALGVWLVPRTIGAHTRVLLGWEADAELVGRVEQLTQTRAEVVDTASAELRRLERDLHDGAQARLVALGMNLRAAERLIPTSPQAAIALVAEAREASSKALTELRDLVRGVYPPVLADRGLADAVRALALDTPVRTETEIDLPGRLDPPVESACYFAIAEALTNAVKHSDARLVQIRMRYARRPAPGLLRIEVTDNGTGGADPANGSGLAGVERRLASFDGILAVSSPVGGPTIIVMEIPCALSSRRISSS